MTVDVASLVRACEAWKLNPDPDLFDNELLPVLRELAQAALRSGNPQSVADWFEVYSSIVGVADEELAELSLEMLERFPEAAAQVPEQLTAGANARLSLQFEPWAAQAFVAESDLAGRLLSAPPTAKAFADSRPVLGAFQGDRTLTSARGYPIVAGLLTLSDRAGSQVGQFRTNTGGGAPSFRKTNGPIPPGTYIVSSYRTRNDKAAMIRDGVGYSLNLDPATGTAVYGRSLFRIHPDGARPGTNGCLGIDENDALLRTSRDVLRDLGSGGEYLVRVAYEGLG